MRLYVSSGHDYLVCPRLLELDLRHGQHPDRWPPCRRGQGCELAHEHEQVLRDLEGHSVNDFFWFPGCRPHSPIEHPLCAGCGRRLVHADLDDLYDPQHLAGPADQGEI